MADDSFRLRGAVVVQNATSGGIQNFGQALNVSLNPSESVINTSVQPTLLTGVSSTNDITNQVQAISSKQQPNGEIALRVSTQGALITQSAPQTVAVDVASGELVPVNANRRYLCIVNHAAVAVVYLAFGIAAEVGKGIRINPNGGAYEMSEANGNLSTQQIRAISTAAATTVGYQEGV